MRFDLIPERDRFNPGWHSRPDTLRAEFTRPEWQWPCAVRPRLGRPQQPPFPLDGPARAFPSLGWRRHEQI